MTETSSEGKTVTYTAQLDAAVTAEATFTGDSGKPNFTDEQKAAQKQAGRALIADITRAAEDPDVGTYVIPAGNYGFDMTNKVSGVASGVVFKDIRRAEDNPFTIKAQGVTFWFEMTGQACPSFTRGLHFVNCAHIYVDGLTLDGYSQCAIEGKIKAIDRAGNRIGLELYEGTMHVDAEVIDRAKSGSKFRIVAVKAGGDLMAPLYNVNNGWGPGSFQGSDLSVDGDGTCWFTFKTDTLMNTIFTDEWTEFYGKNGTLEIGDQIVILYGTVMAVALDNCQQMKVMNLNCYVTKGGFWENGGYGDHLWQNCYFGGRPGTNRLLGGEGHMSQGVRHGSTYDGVTYGLTSDDAINIHGFWSKVTAVTAVDAGYSANISFAPVGIKAGDEAEFYASNGKLVATCDVKEDPVATYNYNGFLTSPIIFTQEPPENYADLLVRWPNSEGDGFTIRNCRFFNDYQRVLINSGSGVIENNTFINVGSNLALTSNTDAYEGGIMKNIVIRNNVFCNVANHPGAVTAHLSQTLNWAQYRYARNISLLDNVFVNCGKMLSAANFRSLSVKGNLIINPMLYGGTVTRFFDLVTIGEADCTVKAYTGNVAYVVDGTPVAGENSIKSTTAEAAARAAAICADKTQSASSMAEKIRNLFG